MKTDFYRLSSGGAFAQHKRRTNFACSILLCIFIFCLPGFAQAQQPPIIPVIDKAMKLQLRSIYRHGITAGNRSAVFMKIGDSITRNRNFLKDIGCGVEVLASHQRLAPTITFFRGTQFPSSYTTAWCGEANSFSRDSLASQNGWTADEPLRRFRNPVSACPPPDDNPLRCELRLLRPSIALIMLGTNDLETNDTANFRKKLTRIVQETLVMGVVPVLSTIPPRLDSTITAQRVAPYNQIIRDIAETLQVPLWNYWLALQGPGIINNGMDNRGIHPNIYNDTDAATFTSAGLRYGFNQRNFTALEVLRKVKAVIQKNAPADVTTTPNFAIYPDQPLAPVQPGTTVTLKVKIARVNFTKPIDFALKSQPAGVSATFATNNAGTSVIVTVTVRSGVQPGEYRASIHGTAGNVVRTTAFGIVVK